MEKQAKITLRTDEEVIEYGININIKNNKINYTETDSKHTNVFLDLGEKLLIRENEELYLEYNFSSNQGMIYLKEIGNNITMNLNTERYQILEKRIEIMYKIDENSYEYIIEMEWKKWVLSKQLKKTLMN